jgi:hypothetical protein
LVGWYWSCRNSIAVLLLFRQRWRMAINRSAEANFSVIQAGLFPIIHMGRPWYIAYHRTNLAHFG